MTLERCAYNIYVTFFRIIRESFPPSNPQPRVTYVTIIKVKVDVTRSELIGDKQKAKSLQIFITYISEMRGVKGTISQTWRVVSRAHYTCWKRCDRYCLTVPHVTRRSRECADRLFRTRTRGEIARETCAEILYYFELCACDGLL